MATLKSYSPWSLFLFLFGVTGAINIQFSIHEELPVPTQIRNLSTTSELSANRTHAEIRALKYHFLEQTEDTKFFNLAEDFGILTIAERIDRDSICSLQCKLALEVAVTSSQNQDFFFTISVAVTVNDVNDNSPVFPRQTFGLNIPENSAPNSTYNIVPASDEDTSALFSIASYDYTPKFPMFSLNVTKKLDGGFVVQLVVKQSLNREDRSFYQIYVTATDGGPNPNTGQMLVNISITDVNDNAPVFSKPVYNVTIQEDTLPNTSIMKVTASDLDSGENARVTYRIITTNNDDIAERFTIRSSTGDLLILQQLKYRPGEVYSMIVEATDHGTTPKVAQTRVNVYVEDSGNNPPVIKVNLPTGSEGVVFLLESVNIGSFVAHVKVEDPDLGDNGRVACQTTNDFFKIESISNGFKVTVNRKLDREKKFFHEINVTCHDFGDPKLSSSASFRVNVTDDNDNDPFFLQSLYTTSVTEKNQIGARITKVSAEDHDVGFNAEISYFLGSDAGSNFAINSNTGVITASSSFDRESTTDFKFTVLAVDQGDPARTGKASVFVTIEDVNDNKPLFNRTIFSFDVRENEGGDSFVGRVVASDADTGDNARLNYFMEENASVPFVVFSDGVIRTTEKLDREKKSQYNFIVFVRDNGDVSLNSSAYVTVFVLDTNDNDPVIIYPSKINHTVWTTTGTSLPIATIQAYDIDDGVNKQLSFYIHSGNDEDVFLLHPESGELILNSQSKLSKDISINLVICVKDAGNPVRSKCAQLVTIVRVNNFTDPETAPRSSSNYIIISIVVVIVTVLVSTAIILTIFFLKRIDRNRRKSNGPLGVPVPNSYSPASSQHDVSSDAEFMERKKEVTFSTSTGYQENFGKSSSLDTLPSYKTVSESQQGLVFDPISTEKEESSNKRSVQLNALRLEQMLLKSPQNQNDRGRRLTSSDNHSDTSQETANSDSGRGGSEDDVPNSQHTGDTSQSIDSPSYNSLPQIPPRKQNIPPRIYPKSSTPNNRTSDSYMRGLSNTDYISNKRHTVHNTTAPPLYSRGSSNHSSMTSSRAYIDSKLKAFNTGMWDYTKSNCSSSYNNIINKDRDYFNLRRESMSTLRSRDDDDDAATTTSGSYTINPEELDEDLFPVHKDLVV